MTPLLRKMYPDPSMGTISHGLVVVMNQAFGYLLPSRHPWSRGNTVERWGRWTPVLSLIPQKWLPALNPCASSSHPLCDTPFPNLHLPEHFRGCVCPHIHWVATMSSAPAPRQLPTNQAPSFFSHLHPPVAVFKLREVRAGFCSCIQDSKSFMLIPVPIPLRSLLCKIPYDWTNRDRLGW